MLIRLFQLTTSSGAWWVPGVQRYGAILKQPDKQKQPSDTRTCFCKPLIPPFACRIAQAAQLARRVPHAKAPLSARFEVSHFSATRAVPEASRWPSPIRGLVARTRGTDILLNRTHGTF